MEVLNFNTGIDFGPTGNLKEFDPTGFSPVPDAVSTWSEASVAELLFRLPPLRHDVRFIVEVFPYIAEGIPRQSCWVFFNGSFVHYQTIKTPVEMMFTVSRELLSPRANRLSFALPDATSPKDVGAGNDLRLLGLSFVKLSAGDASAALPEAAAGGVADGPGKTTRPGGRASPGRTAASPASPPAQPATRDRGGAPRGPQPGGRRSSP